jgi:hypothetical protein
MAELLFRAFNATAQRKGKQTMSKLNRMIQTIANDTGDNVLIVKRRIEKALKTEPAVIAGMMDIFDAIEKAENEKAVK